LSSSDRHTGEDLKHALEDIAEHEGMKSALILEAASLRHMLLRDIKSFPDPWPITDDRDLDKD
jgi:hypothetical protein